jgi:ribosomal protein S18 acetylase RimI-like enzyme
LRRDGTLLSIGVLPEYSGIGIGQELIKQYEDLVKKHNCDYCVLTVITENIAARKAYEKRGFYIERQKGQSLTYIKHIST